MAADQHAQDQRRLEIHISGLLNDPGVRYHIFFYRLYLSEKERQKKDLAKKLQGVVAEIDKELNN
jgi:hypothetical protein